LIRLLTNNWQAGGIATFQTGTRSPYSPATIPAARKTPSTARSRWVRFRNWDVRKPGHYLYDTTNLLTNVVAPGDDSPGVPMFTYGNIGRNTFRTPGIDNFDLSFIKRFALGNSAGWSSAANSSTRSTTLNIYSVRRTTTPTAARTTRQRRPAIRD